MNFATLGYGDVVMSAKHKLQGSRPEFRPIDPFRRPTGKVKPPKRDIGRYEAADDPFDDVLEWFDQDAADSAVPPAVACSA